MKVGVIGGGGFGRALALAARRNGAEVVLWSRRPGDVGAGIEKTTSLAEVTRPDLVILSVPSSHVPDVARDLGTHLAKHGAAAGFELLARGLALEAGAVGRGSGRAAGEQWHGQAHGDLRGRAAGVEGRHAVAARARRVHAQAQRGQVAGAGAGDALLAGLHVQLQRAQFGVGQQGALRPGLGVVGQRLGGEGLAQRLQRGRRGTGELGQIENYELVGKTGTARVARGGSYVTGEHTASFASIWPAEDPQLVAVVKIDNPSKGSIFGGLTVRETAEELGISTRTVDDDWAMARLWLARELTA